MATFEAVTASTGVLIDRTYVENVKEWLVKFYFDCELDLRLSESDEGIRLDIAGYDILRILNDDPGENEEALDVTETALSELANYILGDDILVIHVTGGENCRFPQLAIEWAVSRLGVRWVAFQTKYQIGDFKEQPKNDGVQVGFLPAMRLEIIEV